MLEALPQPQPQGPVGEGISLRDVRFPCKESVLQANRPRSRCAEFTVALGIGFIAFGVTAWILVALTIPLFVNSYIAEWYNMLLLVLGGFALLVSLYVLQIGWGAFRWTGKYRQGKDTDWYKLWEEKSKNSLPPSSSADAAHADDEVLDWSNVQHFVIVPNYKEPIEMLQSLAFSLMSQRTPDVMSQRMCKRQITLVLAMEEREGEEAKQKSQMLTAELSPFFKKVLSTFHPPNVPGDIKGKASNFKWAVEKVEEYIREKALPEQMCLVHVADADSLYDPNYFPNVTYHFCVDANRYEYVWQPCMIPTCNFWELAAPCRQVNTMIAAQEMMAAHDPWEFQIPFSTYGYALRTLQLIGGTGNAADAQDGDVIAEDHHLFIKGFFALEGRLRVHPIFLPCLNFAVGGEVQSCCKNIRDRYIQAKRHMFGISELIYLLVMLVRGRWFSRRTGFGCRGHMRTMGLVFKLTKIHSIPHLGLWVLLGVILTLLLNFDKQFCERAKPKDPDDPTVRDLCLDSITQVTRDYGFFVFSVTTAFTFVGSFGILVSFVRMLQATHHTLQNIANPTGSFMPSTIWDASGSGQSLLEAEPSLGSSSPNRGIHAPETPISIESDSRRRRPIAVGQGFPWFGTLLQLFLEFAVLGFVSSLLFGSIPAAIAITLFICRGHQLEYVTAPKPGTGGGLGQNNDLSMRSLPPGTGTGSPA